MVCPRCGTVFEGNFCPRCGLPSGYAVAPYYQPSSPGRKLLSVVWSLAVAGFLVLILVNLIGLYYGPAFVVPGIQGVSRGASANQGLDAGTANWTFVQVSGVASGSVQGAGGNPGPYLATDLSSGTNVVGYWRQAVAFTGSAPYAAVVRLDVMAQPAGAFSGRIAVALDATPATPDFANSTIARTALWVNGSIPWTRSPAIDLSDRVTTPGTYFLKVAVLATVGGSSAAVGFDNLHLAWTTDAGVFLWLPLPLPELLFFSQDPSLFLVYYILVLAAITVSVLYYALREPHLLVKAFRAPIDAIGARLRSMSAWVAIAQAWMAVTFVQVAIIYLLLASGQTPTTPIVQTAENTWVLLFDLANASVYEELVFRLLLIGVPMVLGSLLWNATRALGRSKPLNHSLRYLFGGRLRKESDREALLAGWVLLIASSVLFGAAHAPGWGWWKVVPAMVAGIGFGYLFLRHGIGAAILAHFATDYISVLPWEGIHGSSEDLVSLLFLALAFLGAGFLAWYIRYGWEQFRDLVGRFTAHQLRQPMPVGPAVQTYAPYPPPQGWSPVPPPPRVPSPPAPPGAGSWTGYPGGPAPVPRDPTIIPPGYVATYRMPPYGYPPVRFQCPACGWIEAKYEGGRFTCLRCGRTA